VKGRFFWVALGLIGASWILNSMYAYSKQLDEPIFLDHYMDVVYQEHLYMTFYYLTNKNDTSSIVSMNAGDVRAYPTEQTYGWNGINQIANRQTFNHYVLRSVNVEFYNPYGTRLDESFTEMDVVFSDGRVVTVPIGHVMMQPPNMEESPLEYTSSGSSSNNFNQSYYRALEPLTIEAIESPFHDELQGDFAIKINTPKNPFESRASDLAFQDAMSREWNDIRGLDVKDVSFPIHLKERDTFRVHSKFPTNSTKVLNMNIHISGTTESGEAFSTTTGIITQPYLEQQTVHELIKAKTKGDTDE